jgi:ubiquinone/menaquinone biosynthesis C-methylase UbiE
MDKNINKSIESYKNSDYEKFRDYDRFKFLISNIKDDLMKSDSLLDIGCAKGELIYLLKEYNDIPYTGLEYSEELLDLTKKEQSLKDVTFVKGDAQNFNLNREFDITVMSGVLSIFDEIENVLKNMIMHTKKGGKGYIFGGFNKEDIDVKIRYKNNYLNSNTWESGWNIFSIKTIESILEPFISSFEYKKFNINIDLPKQKNPVASYTVNLQDSDEKLILTGGGIIRDFYLITFKRKNK